MESAPRFTTLYFVEPLFMIIHVGSLSESFW